MWNDVHLSSDGLGMMAVGTVKKVETRTGRNFDRILNRIEEDADKAEDSDGDVTGIDEVEVAGEEDGIDQSTPRRKPPNY